MWIDSNDMQKRKSSSPELLGQFQPNLAKSFLGWRGFKFVQMKCFPLFQGEIVKKLLKCIDDYKNLLLQNYWANSNQTWHKSSLGQGYIRLFKWRAPPLSYIYNHNFDQMYSLIWTGFSVERCGQWASCCSLSSE